MNPDEIIARLSADPPEGGYAREDITNLIQAFSESTQNYQSLTENSQARVQQLDATNKSQQEEIQRLKAQNFDLMMKQPGIPQNDPPANGNGSASSPMGIDALFEGK